MPTEVVPPLVESEVELAEVTEAVPLLEREVELPYDPLEQEVTSNFLPGLMQQVAVQLEGMRPSRQLAGELIEAAALRSRAMLAEAAKLRTEVEAAKAKVAAEKAEAAAAAAADTQRDKMA